MINNRFVWTTTILIILIYIIGSTVIEIVSNEYNFLNDKAIALGLSQILFIFIPTILIAILLKKEPNNFFKIRFDDKIGKMIPTIIYGIVGFQLLSFGLISFQETLLPQEWLEYYKEITKTFEEMYFEIIDNSSSLGIVKSIIVIALIPAVSEEFLFRGYFQNQMEKLKTPGKAIFWSSLIFAIIHFNPINFIALFIIGFFLGNLAYRTKSIIPSIFAHFLNNLIAVSILLGYSSDENKVGLEMYDINPWVSLSMLLIGGTIVFLSIRAINKS